MKIIRALIIILICSLIFLFGAPKKAHAAVTLNPDPGPIPALQRFLMVISDSYPQTPAFFQWISQRSVPGVTDIPVAYGQTSVPLDYHFSGVIGWGPQFATGTEQRLDGAYATAGGSVSGIGGQVLPFPWFLGNYVGSYMHQQAGMTFTPPVPFTSDITYTIVVVTRTINSFPGPDYQCVGPGNFVGPWDFNGCAPTGVLINVRFDVGPPSAAPSIDIKANGSDGPLSIEQGDSINLTWAPRPGSGPITSCSAVGTNAPSWSGGKPTSSPPGGEFHNGESASFGIKTFTINCNGPGGPTSDSVEVRVAAKPYMRVYSGDVLAGSGFGKCTPTNNSGIIAYNQGASGQFAGAGTQLVAQATGNILQFASAALRFGAANGPGNGLTFANTVNPPWGGSFGSAPCAKDYFASAVNVQNNYTLGTSTGRNEGENLVIYSTGNVYIDGDFTYNDSRWLTTDLISHFYLIVKGNIIIAPNVTRLDGVFIAQPTDPNNPTDGKIYTCATRNAGNAVVIPANLSTDCDTKLTINGAFVAQQVKFLRTLGSLNQGTANEPSTGPSSHAAEVFNYTPALWLGTNPFSTKAINRVDAITSLPPVL